MRRPNGEMRWCVSTAAASHDDAGKVVRISGVTMDITERKEAEERQALLAREVDHRAKNALAIVQSIVRLTKAGSIARICLDRSRAGSRRCRARTRSCPTRAGRAPTSAKLVEEELAPYRIGPCGTNPHLRARRCCWSRPRRRRWRWRCTSLPPMRRSTARCPRRRAGCRQLGIAGRRADRPLARERRAPRRRHRR